MNLPLTEIDDKLEVYIVRYGIAMALLLMSRVRHFEIGIILTTSAVISSVRFISPRHA